MRNVNVVCVNWGTKYSTEYVVRLYQMVKKNTTHKFEMFCLTDNPDIYPDGITGVKLKTGFEGWWNKMQLFRDDMLPVGEYLYFDLDVVIVANIDCLFEYEGFGINILEALYMNCKILSNEINVFKDIYEDSINYFQYNNNDHLI